MVLWPWPTLHCNRCGLWSCGPGPPFTATGVVCALVALAHPSLQQVWSVVLWPWPTLHCNRCGLWSCGLGPPFTATGVVLWPWPTLHCNRCDLWSCGLGPPFTATGVVCGLVALAHPSLQQVWSVVLWPWLSLHCNRCGLWSCGLVPPFTATGVVPPFTATGVVCGLVALALPSLQHVWSVVLSLCPSLNETLQRLSSLASLKQNQFGGDSVAGFGYAPPLPPRWPLVIWVPLPHPHTPPPPPPAPLRRKRR